MKPIHRIVASCIGLAACSVQAAHAGDPAECRVVRMAEPGWNDLAFTTGVADVLFNALGYEAKSDVLGINVIYEGMKNSDLDVFLGYWDPAMVTYFDPYKQDGSVETIGVNLTGAKYTFAVPTYAWEAGVKDFVILEKSDGIGGTWRDNTYPGCACDIPSHLYSFSFAQNSEWSRSYPAQPEIKHYLERVTSHYNLHSR